MFDYPPCWCMFARCGTRRCLSSTRSRLHTTWSAYIYSGLITLTTTTKKTFGFAEVPTNRHIPVQPILPMFVQPAAQSLHVRLPSVFVHLRSLWHPPLFVAHSFTSENTVACIWYQQHTQPCCKTILPSIRSRLNINLSACVLAVRNILHRNDFGLLNCGPTQTFAARGSIDPPASGTIAALWAVLRVNACTLAVAPAVV